MAKNILDQFITLFGDKLPGLQEQHEDPAHTRHASGLSGVERYLAKQAAAEQLAATKHRGATGVEKYLARQAVGEQEAAAKAKPLSGVERYLAKQGLGGGKAVDHAVAEQKSAAKKEPASRVEQYLVDHGMAEEEQQEATATDQPATKVAKYLASLGLSTKKTAVVRQLEPTIDTFIEQPQPVEHRTPKSPDIALPSNNAGQCQATTAKGTQCTRNVNLTEINRTINEKGYRFTVCRQHKKANFKPYPAFIGN